MQNVNVVRRSTDDGARQSIVEAARDCFARVGVQRTRMEDVARGAGMSRQAVYRYVAGRDDLVELAIVQRCREFATELTAASDAKPADVVEAMIELMLRLMKAAREDAEFVYLAEAMPRVRLNLLLTSAGSLIHGVVGGCFEPLFVRAADEGLLRDDITRREMVEWLQGILTQFTPRADLDVSETRRYLKEFALRSLLQR
ncbi:TetR/AcrR family transcriptional regulator [Mycolicibacterium sp. CH28]|uniref:TetR/AcrR family transcriptional regulator n=1 Tax=Mycolicibacterium sp. CH28 TaxID=2512237 RepID=UPI001080D2B9|nr:TetR/AcrR family transcriptional regulator [Mycolicibacterium sp. CH28]TGD88390.1 TetR/AcrR family transcriptional regulator [Mycolicibacterium sp. CH28]